LQEKLSLRSKNSKYCKGFYIGQTLDAERITYKNKEDNAGASFQRNMNRIQNECFKEDLISSIDTSREKFHKKTNDD
jgi:hypothetical protein